MCEKERIIKILNSSTFIKADENREYKPIHISSISLKGIEEQRYSEDNSKVKWNVFNV